MQDDLISEQLTPSEEEQSILILQGKCPHNKGWVFLANSHNDAAYRCRMCSEIEYY